MRKLGPVILQFSYNYEIDYLINACRAMKPKMSEYEEFIKFLESLKS